MPYLPRALQCTVHQIMYKDLTNFIVQTTESIDKQSLIYNRRPVPSTIKLFQVVSTSEFHEY